MNVNITIKEDGNGKVALKCEMLCDGATPREMAEAITLANMLPQLLEPTAKEKWYKSNVDTYTLADVEAAFRHCFQALDREATDNEWLRMVTDLADARNQRLKGAA